MQTMVARELAKMPIEALQAMPEKTMLLKFDDGEIITNTRRNQLSWFHWKLNNEYPDIPFTKDMHVGGGTEVYFDNIEFIQSFDPQIRHRIEMTDEELDKALVEFNKQHTFDRKKPNDHYMERKGRLVRKHLAYPSYTTNTSLDIFGIYTRRIHEHYKNKKNYDREEVWRTIYEQINALYNHFVVATQPNLTSSDILDYLELYDHPVIAALNRTVRPTQKSLDTTYDGIKKIIYEDYNIRFNPVVIAARAGLVKIDQVCQMIGPRGYMTDIDSNIFQRPILVGYFEGITTLYDAMIESRSAAKSLTFNKKPLRQVEYFNRKMQLLGSVVYGLVPGDCGSDRYLNIGIDKNNLKYIEGLYRVEKDNKLVAMTREDKHLIGTIQRLRIPVNCKHRGTGYICETCFGELSYSVPKKTNLGHLCNIEMCQKGSQLVMSVKHYDGSSKVAVIAISDHDLKYITHGSMVSTLGINPELKEKNPYILLPISDKGVLGAEGLGNITATTDIACFSIGRLTQFRTALIGCEDVHLGTGEVVKTENFVNVSVGSRYGSLTLEFLQHYQRVGGTITEDGYYKISLKDWDYEQNVFELPMRHINMLDVMSVIETFIRSPRDTNSDKRSKHLKKLTGYDAAEAAIVDMCELVNERLDVNMAHMAVIILATMRGTRDPYDYSIPDYDEPYVFESHSVLMEYRSKGQEMAYERQPTTFDNVDSYLIKRRPHGILDEMIIDR